MSEHPKTDGSATSEDAPPLAEGTDVDGAALDHDADPPATSDPEQFTEDSDLGGTHGSSPGGAG